MNRRNSLIAIILSLTSIGIIGVTDKEIISRLEKE